MNFNELKELARKLGGILVMNGNTPEFVITPFENFQKMERGKPIGSISANDEDGTTIERLNKEISALKEEIRQKEEAELLREEEESEIAGESPEFPAEQED